MADFRHFTLVPPTGLEPVTPALRMRQKAVFQAVTPLERGVSGIVEREMWAVCDPGAIPASSIPETPHV